MDNKFSFLDFPKTFTILKESGFTFWIGVKTNKIILLTAVWRKGFVWYWYLIETSQTITKENLSFSSTTPQQQGDTNLNEKKHIAILIYPSNSK